MEEIPQVYAKNTNELRKWFEKNHTKYSKVLVVYYKKHTKKDSIIHKDAMLEAICFGWIDTTAKRLDDERYCAKFVKRTEKGKWSTATLSYAKKLIKEGRMTPSGLKAYKNGLKFPPIDAGYSKNPNPPEDLIERLRKNKLALNNFEKLAPSYKRHYINWILSAKREETRLNRIKETVDRLSNNKKMYE